MKPEVRSRLEAQRRRSEEAQELANEEQALLVAMAVEVHEKTGASYEAIGEAIGYSKQRVHQFVVEARTSA